MLTTTNYIMSMSSKGEPSEREDMVALYALLQMVP
jgi:hypothetical protein